MARPKKQPVLTWMNVTEFIIKAQGHPDSNVGVRHIVGWLSTRPGEEFIDFLQSHYPICELFHTDDYQTAFYRLIDRRTLGVDAN